MSPRAKILAAQISIPIAALIALAGVIVGNWIIVTAMVLLAIAQILNYRANRDRL